MRRLVIVCAAAIGLARCVTSDRKILGDYTYVAANLKPVDVATIQDGARERLKDPESARFGPIRAVKDEAGQLYACGLVDSKNSFGGYVGMQPFDGVYADLGKVKHFAAVAVGGDQIALDVAQRLCAEQGMPL